jgi:hypothetical protein
MEHLIVHSGGQAVSCCYVTQYYHSIHRILALPLIRNTHYFPQFRTFLGAFAKLRKGTINSVMSVRPLPAWNRSAPSGQMFMKLDT